MTRRKKEFDDKPVPAQPEPTQPVPPATGASPAPSKTEETKKEIKPDPDDQMFEPIDPSPMQNPFLYPGASEQISRMRVAFQNVMPSPERILEDQEAAAIETPHGSIESLGIAVETKTTVEEDFARILPGTKRAKHDLLDSVSGVTYSIGSSLDSDIRGTKPTLGERDDKAVSKLLSTVPSLVVGDALPRFSGPSFSTKANVFNVSSGLYLFGAATGAGKTVHSAAMYLRFSSQPDGPERVRYLYIYEPGANPNFTLPNTAGKKELAFSAENPQNFENDLKAYVQADGAQLGKVYILDSITRVYRNFLPAAALEKIGSATFPGGLQSADVAAIAAIDGFAQRNNVTIIATVNNEVVPFGDVLEAACQGRIEIVRFGRIRIKDRVNARKWTEYDLSDTEVHAALELVTPSN